MRIFGHDEVGGVGINGDGFPSRQLQKPKSQRRQLYSSVCLLYIPNSPVLRLNDKSLLHTKKSRDRLLVERRAHDQKVVSSNPGRSGRRIFFSTINFLC